MTRVSFTNIFHFQRLLRPRQNVVADSIRDKKKGEETVMVKRAEIAPARTEQKSVEIKHFVWHFSHYFYFFRRLDLLKSKSPRHLERQRQHQHPSAHKNQNRRVSAGIFVDGQGPWGLTASRENTGIVFYFFVVKQNDRKIWPANMCQVHQNLFLKLSIKLINIIP